MTTDKIKYYIKVLESDKDRIVSNHLYADDCHEKYH